MTNRLPPRVHESDLRDPERWLKEHVYNSDENERAYEVQECPRPYDRPVPWKNLLANRALRRRGTRHHLGSVPPEGLV
jgi:hypothetical protein